MLVSKHGSSSWWRSKFSQARTFNISACENSLHRHNLFSSISVSYIVWGQYTVTSVRCGHFTLTVTQGVVRWELNVASGWSGLWYIFSTLLVVKKVHLCLSQSSLPPLFFISSTPFMINYERHSRSSHLWAFPVFSFPSTHTCSYFCQT